MSTSTGDNGSQTQNIVKIKIKFILSPNFRVNWSAVEHGSSYLTFPGSTNTVGIWGLLFIYIFGIGSHEALAGLDLAI